MKNYTYLLLMFLLSFCTLAQTVKRSKVVSNGGVHGMAYHPNVGMVVLHLGTYLGFPALNAQGQFLKSNVLRCLLSIYHTLFSFCQSQYLVCPKETEI
jgi:hypothetical protein